MRFPNSLILIGSVVCLPIFACEMDEVNTALANSSKYQNFTQVKTIPALSRPLNSSGIMWLSPDSELVWQVNKPLKSTMIISAESFRQLNKNDELQPEISNSMVQDLSLIFLNVLSGQLQQLNGLFKQELSCDNENWQITLEPIDRRFSDIISFISLEGDSALQKISFREVRGDVTEIFLSEFTSDQVGDLEAYLAN